MRLWIYLSNNDINDTDSLCSSEDILDLCDSTTNTSFIKIGQGALLSAGFPVDAPVYAAGHGCGGYKALKEVRQEPDIAEGVVVVGASLAEGDHDDFLTPTMVVNGDLDGIMRFVSIALNFRLVLYILAGM